MFRNKRTMELNTVEVWDGNFFYVFYDEL